ncbi:MAG: diguanylate cyclase [Planctomycetes bacterium]|nr:diguanylate cyclase [Planctomycetota bacterium]
MRVLVADDDAVFRRMAEALLSKWGYEVITCVDGAEALRILQGPEAPHLAVLDWVMPGLDGTQICREVRAQSGKPYTYILVLTAAKVEKENLIEGMDAGADDYLLKPYDAGELKARLQAGRRIVELQDQLIAARESLRTQATHDTLTGLWNRGAIIEFLHKEVERARRSSAPLSVAMADLDHFKQINDTRGHAVGDAVLRIAARRLMPCLRPYDSIGRYGGEEFLVVLPGCGEADAVATAERLRNSLGATPIETSAGPVPVTLSLGVASSPAGETGAGEDDLLRASDDALYQAKNGGRNRVAVAAKQDLPPRRAP